ncbi:MAG: tripartite tricarboxylate transporter substrate binding protein [Betaproteobacteria bacterium]|nr:tripartite tricarboxylate transporter substrate binding protein [Betaproteobacteria bacterium]
MKKFSYLCGILAASAVFLIWTAAATAAWPEKNIRVIIPWAPGGSTDIVGRIIAPDMTSRLKQQVVIDNRPGAGSIVGLQVTSQQPPDGHTFLLTSTAYGFLIQKSNVDLVNTFDSTALVGFADSALVVHPSLPVSSVKELIALAKKRPGQLLYSSSGIGGFPHMNTELFKLMTGVDMIHVPFKGGGPAIADTVAGHTQIHLGSLPTEMPHIRGGKLKVLAVGGKKRNPALPDKPTISETVPGYVTYIWYGFFAPKGTPANLIASMNAAVSATAKSPDIVKKLDAQGVEAATLPPAEFAKLMRDETDKWQDVIKRAGIKGE